MRILCFEIYFVGFGYKEPNWKTLLKRAYEASLDPSTRNTSMGEVYYKIEAVKSYRLEKNTIGGKEIPYEDLRRCTLKEARDFIYARYEELGKSRWAKNLAPKA